MTNLNIGIYFKDTLHISSKYWHCVPRVGEHVDIRYGGENIICRVYRVVYLTHSLGPNQQIDIYVTDDRAPE